MASVRGSNYQTRPAGPSETLKAVEALFETQTVVEIEEVQTKTRTDIEEKKKQLRLLVGSSYRDLISSADTILRMANSCNTVLNNVKELQNGFASLATSATRGSELKERSQEASNRKHLHAIGSRIKYLVDTPEMIWGFLDTHAYLDAARRYLRAAEVHSLLTKAAPSELRHRFPLVNRQWPNIQKFRIQIQEHYSHHLNQQELLSAQGCATVLAAAASLQGLTSHQALDLLLESRQRTIRALIEGAADVSDQLPSEHAMKVLKEALHIVQETLWQLGRLFLSHHGSEHTALLPAAVTEDSLSGELLFGPLSGASDNYTASEAEAWKAISTGISERVRPLSQQESAQAADKFLAAVAQLFGGSGKQFLASSCKAAKQLASLETSLRAAIAEWVHKDTSPSEGDNILSPRRSFQPSTPKRGAAVPAEELPVSWDGVCDWVLTKRISLWDVILEPAFMQVGKDLIASAFAALERDLQMPLLQYLQDARETPAAPPGSYRAASWPEGGSGEKAPGRKRARYDESGRSAPSQAASDHQGKAWRQRLPGVQEEFNSRLQQILRDALLLLANQAPGREVQPRRGYFGRTFPLPPSQSRGRAAVLDPFVQQTCAQTALRLATRLAELLESLPEAGPGAEGSPVIEQALLIGRFSLSMGSSETILPVALGPPDGWKEAQLQQSTSGFAGLSDGSRAKARTPSTKSQFPAIQQNFRQIALKAHKLWAAWTAAALGRELQQSMAEDAALVSTTALRTWQETVISQEEESGGNSEETRFQLPAVPSPGVMMVLLAAGRELQRAGGAIAGSSALEVLEWDLGSAVTNAFRSALESGTVLEQKITEKGVLQLLFDARLLKDVLSGGKPTAGVALEATQQRQLEAAIAERRHEFTCLEAGLQERLDPIDWAIYGMYLWQNEAALYQRVRILYGSLLQLNRIHMEVLNKPSPSGEANILSMAPMAARFAYLPISTPSATAAGLRRLPTTGTLQSGVDDHGQSNNYSFANLGGLRAGAHAEREAETAATTAFEALQSRFTSQRLGALGSLLGDRAAEVTAMAQQSFSDIVLPTAFTSALGGSTTGATGLLASLRGFRSGASAE